MSKVKEVIASLQKLDPEMEVYFDCPTCQQSNVFHMAEPVVLIETKRKREANRKTLDIPARSE